MYIVLNVGSSENVINLIVSVIQIKRRKIKDFAWLQMLLSVSTVQQRKKALLALRCGDASGTFKVAKMCRNKQLVVSSDDVY